MPDRTASFDSFRDDEPVTYRERRPLHQRSWDDHDHQNSRLDPAAVLTGGLIILLVAAIAQSLSVVAVGVFLCLGAIIAAIR